MIEGIIVQTLVKGSVYALLALGFALIFGVARVLQLSHTAFYMLAAYGIFTFAELTRLEPGCVHYLVYSHYYRAGASGIQAVHRPCT